MRPILRTARSCIGGWPSDPNSAGSSPPSGSGRSPLRTCELRATPQSTSGSFGSGHARFGAPGSRTTPPFAAGSTAASEIASARPLRLRSSFAPLLATWRAKEQTEDSVLGAAKRFGTAAQTLTSRVRHGSSTSSTIRAGSAPTSTACSQWRGARLEQRLETVDEEHFQEAGELAKERAQDSRVATRPPAHSARRVAGGGGGPGRPPPPLAPPPPRAGAGGGH